MCDPIAPGISLLVERLSARDEARCQFEKRRSRRVPKDLIVDGVCLDENFVPDDRPFLVTVFDLSRHGLGLLHTEPLNASYIAFQMMPDTRYVIQVFATVVRCTQFDDVYYSIGCEFYTRLGDMRRLSS